MFRDDGRILYGNELLMRGELTEKERETWERIEKEPESLLDDEE